jgi:hypothetical protein
LGTCGTAPLVAVEGVDVVEAGEVDVIAAGISP